MRADRQENVYIEPHQGYTLAEKPSFISYLINKDCMFAEMQPLVFRILNAFPNHIPGGKATVDMIKSKAAYIGYLEPFKAIYNLKMTNQTSLMVYASLLTVTSQAILIASSVVSSQTQAYINTAVAVAKFAAGMSLALTALDIYRNPKKDCAPDYFMMIGVASCAYLKLAPMLLSAPKYISEASFAADVIIGTGAITDLFKDVIGYISQK